MENNKDNEHIFMRYNKMATSSRSHIVLHVKVFTADQLNTGLPARHVAFIAQKWDNFMDARNHQYSRNIVVNATKLFGTKNVGSTISTLASAKGADDAKTVALYGMCIRMDGMAISVMHAIVNAATNSMPTRMNASYNHWN